MIETILGWAFMRQTNFKLNLAQTSFEVTSMFMYFAKVFGKDSSEIGRQGIQKSIGQIQKELKSVLARQ
jgi:hypothetical protein